ncbi:MAG: (Fe-S)-binding protein [Methylocella sp.]
MANATVGLFVTCLADLIRPRTAFAALTLLRRAGCEVEAPASQTCCGQPAFNSGDRGDAERIARNVIRTFEGYDYTVAPSGSCMGMIKLHYPELFADDPAWLRRAEALAEKSYELTSFLVDVIGYHPEGIALAARATYHDSCSGLRELKVLRQPRALLSDIQGLTLTPLPDAEACCGFGGTFCVKYPAISNAIVDEKAARIEATNADLLLGGDLGCLFNMAGKLHRRGSRIRAFHVAEILAGMGDGPAIGEEP